MRLRVEASFHYIGRVSYSLGDSFEGERYIFADTMDWTRPRLLIVHFERIKARSAEIYRYNLEAGERIGSLRFIQNEFAFAGVTTITPSPRDEADRTNNFLLLQGFRMPSVWLVTRFVTIGSTDRKSELIVFYMEGHDDLSLRELYSGEEPTAAWQQLKRGVATRGRAVFSID